jgi:hypothetical protein
MSQGELPASSLSSDLIDLTARQAFLQIRAADLSELRKNRHLRFTLRSPCNDR